MITVSADGKIEDTGPAHEEAHGDHRRRDGPRPLSTSSSARTRPDKPFFCWWSGTRMHFRTHVKPELRGDLRSGRVFGRHGRARHAHRPVPRQARRARDRRQHARVLQHGQRTALQHVARRRLDAVPRREEHELGGRLARAGDAVRWPGHIDAGSVSNEIMHHMDWLPTFAAVAGDDGVKEKLLKGYKANALGRDYKVHLDGYNFLPHPDRQGEDKGPAGRDLLLLGRWRPHGAALPGLEGDLHGAADLEGHVSQAWSEPFMPAASCP